jgi:prepilin-type N-terminal cleavage/methylation domain-containing protein
MMAPAEYSTLKAEDRRTRVRQRDVIAQAGNVQRPTSNIQRSTANSRKGMSLLEVILAIAVAGFVLAAAVSFLVSISTIWTERSQRHFFEDHVDGVTEFLNATFTNAGVEIALGDSAAADGTTSDGSGDDNPPPNTNEPIIKITNDGNDSSQGSSATTADSGGLMRASDEPVGWARPPGFADYKEPLLNFKLTEAPPLLVGLENAPLLGVDAFLYFEKDEGLGLLWYSILQEETDDISDLRRTAISPLVTAIHYIYWDERFEKWEEEKEPKEGDGDDQYILPRFIKLIFEYEGESKERTLTIPVPSKSALIF